MSDRTSNKQQDIDLAWSKLQAKLEKETPSDKWSEWSEKSVQFNWSFENERKQDSEKALPILEVKKSTPTPTNRRSFRWAAKTGKWAAAVAVVGLVVGFAMVPAGNKAIANLLGQFRMQKITTVEAEDARKLFDTMIRDGKERQANNKFGTFTRKSGVTGNVFVTPKEAEKLIDRKVLVPKDWDPDRKVHVSATDAFTFKVNVKEVNEMLRRVGATKLLPDSIDGKEINFELGKAVRVDTIDGDKSRSKGYSLIQQPVPKVTVDPSVPIEEAVDAILDFPLLPDELKSSLRKSDILNGNAPLPVIVDGKSSNHRVSGTDVVVNERPGDGNEISAAWVKDNILYILDGYQIKNKDELLAIAAEYIKQ